MREILEGKMLSEPSSVSPVPIEWRYLAEFADRNWPEPFEDGPTFAANAEIKARHYARLSAFWTVADDSGLVVDALGGEPGVRSARYAGEPKNDKANNALLIQRLTGVSAERRTARFCCAVVLAGIRDRAPAGQPKMPHPPIEVLASAEGSVEGLIIDEPRGSNGFGYDPHFWVPQFGITTAEMPSEQKHAISHRGQALRRLRAKLGAMIEC